MAQNIIQPYRHVSPAIQVCHNCTESVNCDTQAVNPDSGIRQQYGFRVDSGADAIGRKLTEIIVRWNQTVGATGTMSVYSKDTVVATFDVSTLVSDYYDYTIPCTGSPTLAENDVFWWENNADRVTGGDNNINTKVQTGDPVINPTGYTYMQSQNNAYGVAPTNVHDQPVSNMCFTVE